MHEGDQDAADAARVLAGDLNAFEGIVRRWQQRLVTLAWRFCRDRALAEDMAQEAFFKAFRSLAAFRGEAAFSTWLTAVALNTYRSRLRAEGPPSILVFYFQEKSISEAARVLGIAEGTLKARLHRGRELLRHKCANLKSHGARGYKEE